MDDDSSREDSAKRTMVDDIMARARPQQVGALAEVVMASDDSQLKLGLMLEASRGSAARFAIAQDLHPYAASKILAASGHIGRDHPFLHGGKGEERMDSTPAILAEIGREGLTLWGGYYENFHDREAHAAHLRAFGAAGVMAEARKPDADLGLVAELAEKSALRMGQELRSGDASSLRGVYDWMRGMAEVSVEIARREMPLPLERKVSREERD